MLLSATLSVGRVNGHHARKFTRPTRPLHHATRLYDFAVRAALPDGHGCISNTSPSFFLLHYICPSTMFPTKAIEPVIEACSWSLPFAAGTTNAWRSISTSTVHHHDVTRKYLVKATHRSGVHKSGRQNLVQWRLILVAQNFEVTPKIWGYLARVSGVCSSVCYPNTCSEHTMHNVNDTEPITGVPAVF
jgi:hypothetical protein